MVGQVNERGWNGMENRRREREAGAEREREKVYGKSLFRHLHLRPALLLFSFFPPFLKGALVWL